MLDTHEKKVSEYMLHRFISLSINLHIQCIMDKKTPPREERCRKAAGFA